MTWQVNNGDWTVEAHGQEGRLANFDFVIDLFKAAGMDVDGCALGNNDYPKAKVINFIADDVDETGLDKLF